jgi:putative transposase
MSNLRRYNPAGRPVFVTIVTFARQPLLLTHAEIVLDAIQKCERTFQIRFDAWVILRDHLHLMLNLHGADLSQVVHRLKMSFAGAYRRSTGRHDDRLWQKRFWDHIIRDEADYRRHIDYIHFNPVRHGYAYNPFDYPYSSAREFLQAGTYEPDWGVVRQVDPRDFGE